MNIIRPGPAAKAFAAMLVCAVLVGAGVAMSMTAEAGGPAPIGSGWTEIHPAFKVDQPPGFVRYSVTNGVTHCFALSTDPSTFPGHDSGPRCELRFRNDYTSGQAQFQADMKVTSGCQNWSVMQVFGATGHSTAFMAWATAPNRLSHYSNETIFTPLLDQTITLNVIHDTATGMITVYVNGALRGTFQDHGPGRHYFKVGVYHQVNSSPRCDNFISNVHIFKK